MSLGIRLHKRLMCYLGLEYTTGMSRRGRRTKNRSVLLQKRGNCRSLMRLCELVLSTQFGLQKCRLEVLLERQKRKEWRNM